MAVDDKSAAVGHERLSHNGVGFTIWPQDGKWRLTLADRPGFGLAVTREDAIRRARRKIEAGLNDGERVEVLGPDSYW